MSKADLMLILNKTLQKAGKRLDTYFFQIRYALLRVVSTLFTKKVNTRLLIL